MFHLINSLNLSTFIGLLLLAIFLGLFALIKYKREKAPWKAILCIAISEMMILIANRIIKEYKPDTLLYKISLIATLVCGGIFLISIFIGAYFTQKKTSKTGNDSKTQGDGSSVLTKDELRGIFLSRW